MSDLRLIFISSLEISVFLLKLRNCVSHLQIVEIGLIQSTEVLHEVTDVYIFILGQCEVDGLVFIDRFHDIFGASGLSKI